MYLRLSMPSSPSSATSFELLSAVPPSTSMLSPSQVIRQLSPWPTSIKRAVSPARALSGSSMSAAASMSVISSLMPPGALIPARPAAARCRRAARAICAPALYCPSAR